MQQSSFVKTRLIYFIFIYTYIHTLASTLQKMYIKCSKLFTKDYCLIFKQRMQSHYYYFFFARTVHVCTIFVSCTQHYLYNIYCTDISKVLISVLDNIILNCMSYVRSLRALKLSCDSTASTSLQYNNIRTFPVQHVPGQLNPWNKSS